MVASGRAQLDRLVAVTFTEKAAGELKLRLRTEIERGRQDTANFDDTSRQRLTDALEQLEEARIGTIHSFCADLLREYPVEAGVDPMFEVAPDDVTGELFESAFERWFQDTLANPGPGVRRVLRRRSLADRDGPRPILSSAAWELLAWRDFDRPWQHEPFDRDAAIDELIDELLAHGDLASQHPDPDDWLRKGMEQVARPIREAIRLETVRTRDYDALEDTLLRLLRGSAESLGMERSRRSVRRSAAGGGLCKTRRAEAAPAGFSRTRRGEFGADAARRDLAGGLLLSQLKQRAGRLDFLDLLLITRDLVRDDRTVRNQLQSRFSRIFVDEFQDTDPLQAEILLLLAADDSSTDNWLEVTPKPGKLFIVGDPKQSIYRFRRADVALYQSVKRAT